jgi:serine/threonine protein kinase
LGDYYGQPGAAYIGEHYTMFELADENLFDVLERLDHDDSEDDCFEKFICLMKQVFYQLAWLAKDAHVTHNDLYTSNIMCIEAESDMVVNIDGPFAAHNTQNTTIQLHIKEGWPIVKIIDFGIASIVDKYNGFDYVRDNL